MTMIERMFRAKEGRVSRIRRAGGWWAAVLSSVLSAVAAETVAERGEEATGAAVVVLYNTNVPGSRDVAEHYASRRGVPSRQLVGLALPTSEVISRTEYETKLERELVKELESRELLSFRDQIQPATETAPGRVARILESSKIRYLVPCYGVPLRFTNDVSRVEPEVAALPEQLRRAEAAVDADLTVLPLLLAGQPRTGPLANPFFAATNAAVLHPTQGLFVVGRLDGPKPEMAAALVDRALDAERNGLWGRGYFDLRSITDPAYVRGDQWISNAWAAVEKYGFETAVDTRSTTFPAGYPLSQVAFYAGWYDTHVSGPFALPQVEFMPGAVAYHLHSYSATTLRSTNQYWVGPLVAKGVTATMGMVAEPYLDGTPEIGLCLARFMYYGFSWGEAALVSQRLLSWQLTVVGDPLYRPFRMNALDRAKDLAARSQGRLDWALVTLYNRKQELTRNLDATIQELETEPRLKFSPLLEEKLGDFLRRAGRHEKAAEAYRRAAVLLVSPQQRKRLIWEYSEQLEAAGRKEDAYDALVQYAAETKVPPDPRRLYERLRDLAGALGREEPKQRWTRELEQLEGTNGAAR